MRAYLTARGSRRGRSRARERLERSRLAFTVFLATAVPALASAVLVDLPVFKCVGPDGPGACGGLDPAVTSSSWFVVLIACAAMGVFTATTVVRLARV